MKYTPPAASAYSPSSRALLLANSNRHQNKSARNSLIFLYLILRFWDTPVLNKYLHSLSKKCIEFSGKSKIGKTILSSKPGIFLMNFGKRIAVTVVNSIFTLAEVTRADKVGILPIPKDLQNWVNKNSSSKNNEICNRDDAPINSSVPKDSCEEMDKVLYYWFGQYNPEKSQKQLWMIAASSEKHRQAIDEEIKEKFLQYLIDLGQSNSNPLTKWKSSYGWKGYVASIIVLDQMSRHIHRHFQTVGINCPDLKSQAELDALALDVAVEFQKRFDTDIRCGMIPIPMMIFSLMPLRHRSALQSVGFVQTKIEEMASLYEVDFNNMIRRFRRATTRRMNLLQDEARREGKETVYDAEAGDCDTFYNSSEQNLIEEEKGEVSTGEFGDNDILEFDYFQCNMDDASKAAVVKTMIQYLNDRGIFAKSLSKEKGFVPRDTPIIVSLSGGVDSMAIASVLAYLRDNCGFTQLYLAAVHIDYGNRPESSAEASYVQRYAKDILAFDTCIVRRIDEVTRGVTKRDEYEQYSRNVRYDLYRQTVKECITACEENNPNRKICEVGVMLGHHRGDVVENVISNSNKGCGPLDLSGMTSLSKNDGVTIYRPLLPLEKVDVFAYSHKYGVPYFKDTTPFWSTRGKLRNKLIPLLEEVYGDGCLSNLAALAQESDQARELFNISALKPFMEKVQYFPMGVIISTKEFAHQGSYFWKIVLRDLLHSIGLGMFTDKSTETFLKRILPKKITSGKSLTLVHDIVIAIFLIFKITSLGWLQCRKDYGVYLMEDRRVLILVSIFMISKELFSVIA